MSDPTVATPAPTNTQDETRSLVKAAGVIGMATFSSRILGFIRDMVLASLFGATPAADAFFVAYRVPNLLRELFAEGSMSSAFIPVFTEYQTQKSKRDAWELASAVFTTLLTIVIGVTIVGILAAPGIVWLLAPGFHDDPAKLGATTLLTRIMFPYLIFISLAALAMGILNSMRAFAAPAFSPVFFNICIIGCAFFLSPMMAEPIHGVAIGVVAGGVAQFALQLPGLRRRGMLFGFRFSPGHPGVRRIGKLMVPSLLGLSVTQINITVSTILASFFVGGPTYLFYGMRLIQFPLGIFGVALATAILPTLSAQAARGDLGELRKTLGFGLRMILFIILPARRERGILRAVRPGPCARGAHGSGDRFGRIRRSFLPGEGASSRCARPGPTGRNGADFRLGGHPARFSASPHSFRRPDGAKRRSRGPRGAALGGGRVERRGSEPRGQGSREDRRIHSERAT